VFLAKLCRILSIGQCNKNLYNFGNCIRNKNFTSEHLFPPEKRFFDSSHLAEIFLEDDGCSTRNRVTYVSLYTLAVSMDTSNISEIERGFK
jgi:hypothetical protein